MSKKNLYKRTIIHHLTGGQFVFVVTDTKILYSRNYGRSFVEYPLSVSGCVGGNVYMYNRNSMIKAVQTSIVKTKNTGSAWVTQNHSVSNIVKVADGNNFTAIQCVCADDQYVHKINTDGTLPTSPNYFLSTGMSTFTGYSQHVSITTGSNKNISFINNTPAVAYTYALAYYARLTSGMDYFLGHDARVYKLSGASWVLAYNLGGIGCINTAYYGSKVSDGYGQMRCSENRQKIIIADAKSAKVFFSSDYAASFTELVIPGMSNPFLADLSETAQHLYVASKTHGLFVSNDGGATWTKRLDAMNFKNLYVEKRAFELDIDEFYGNI